MAKEWEGRTYDEDWHEINAMGERIGQGKDWNANAEASNAWGGLNPYTNKPGPSPYDQSGLIPGNEPGSTLAPVPPGGAPATTTTSTTTPTTYTGTTTGLAPNTTDTNWKGLDTAVSDRLMGDIKLDGSVDVNDPAFKSQMDANALQTNLAADRSRAAMAQRRAATGTGSSGAVDTDANKVLEQQALQDKTFQGGLMDKFRQQNIDRMQTALTLGSGMLTAQQERDLRAALTREGYKTQTDISDAGNKVTWDVANLQDRFNRDDLGFRSQFGYDQLDQNALLAMLGGG